MSNGQPRILQVQAPGLGICEHGFDVPALAISVEGEMWVFVGQYDKQFLPSNFEQECADAS